MVVNHCVRFRDPVDTREDILLTPELWWTAGVLEGEGSFIVKNDGGVYVCCSMTDLDVLEKLKAFCGGYISKRSKEKQHYKQCWRWQINGAKAYDLAYKIRPLMSLRRKTAIDILLNAYNESPLVLCRVKHKEMRDLFEQGWTHQAIADLFGCSRSNVTHIILGDKGKALPESFWNAPKVLVGEPRTRNAAD